MWHSRKQYYIIRIMITLFDEVSINGKNINY